ncbi:MAG: nucleoside kinase [Anaerolineales bacterium]|nr:nucleoside kinase [Anaerolineales bacterium]
MTTDIREVPRRETVQIILPDDRVLEGPIGDQLESFFSVLKPKAPIVGAIVNNSLRELTYPIEIDSYVRPVTMADPDGMRIYRRSLTFLLAAAFDELFPEAKLTVDHSVSSGGYYCEVTGREPLSSAELERLENRMAEMVEANLPFAKTQMPIEKAINHFKTHGLQDKVRLLAHRRKPHLVLYQLGEHKDYHHGYMLPSTGYLKWFALAKTDGAFTLRFPRRHRPTELLPLPEYPNLLATFREYGDWLQTLGISSIGALNDAIANERAIEVILISEALHEGRISEIAGTVANREPSPKVIFVAGPSSSGKTTFSKRLSIQLLVRGVSPFPLELDHFFVDRVNTPRDEKGEYDYESLEALDLDRLNHDLHLLIEGKEVQLPKYNFITGVQEEGEVVHLERDQRIILEGIHGLNPDLVQNLPSETAFRVYVSALTQLNLDRLNRVSTTDTRLIRRIVRDAKSRGYTAAETIRRWESVRRGEKRYIFPFQENADVMFNSALMYEGSALAPLAEPLIRQVPFGTEEHVEAKRLLAFLEWFLPIETDFIPDNSIMREFTGGSILRKFNPWRAP